MKDLFREDPKQVQLQSELCHNCKKELRQCPLSVDFVQETQWAEAMECVIAISEMCRTCHQMARRPMKVGSDPQKTKVERISLAQTVLLGILMNAG